MNDSAVTYQLAMPLALPLWLELAAPAVLAYGFAPAPKRPEPKTKAKRRKVKRRKVKRRKAKRRKAKRRPRSSAKHEVVDWAREYRQRNGRDPCIPEVSSLR